MAVPATAIFGLGRAGRALAEACVREGAPLKAVGVRSERSRGRDFESAPLHVGLAGFLSALEPGTIVLLAVPDDAIEIVAAEAAQHAGAKSLRFCHLSGAQGVEPLKPLVDAGASCGAFHVLQSFPAENGAGRVPGSHVGVAGDNELLADLRALAAALGLTPFELRDEQRAAYHAAAVLASNALVAMLGAGRDILVEAGFEPGQAAEMLLPLVKGTLGNVEGGTIEEALTGPIVRGDAGTIRRHLGVLTGQSRATYLGAVRATLVLAEKAGRTPPEKLAEIRRLIDEA